MRKAYGKLGDATPSDHLGGALAEQGSACQQEMSDGHLEPLLPTLLACAERFQGARRRLRDSHEPARALELRERGARVLTHGLASSILIIEDEPIVAMDLESIVQDLGRRVVGVVRAHGQEPPSRQNGSRD